MSNRLLHLLLLLCAFGVSSLASAAQNNETTDADSEEDPSVIESVTETLGDAIGILTRKVRTEGEEGIPRRIAVLPAVGQGDERERDDIRTAIHNNLSSKNFELLKPFDIDRVLTQLEQVDGSKHTDFDPQELAKKLDVEGLVYVDVPLVEQVYAAAYAHYKITIKLSFYSVADNNYIWEKEESIAEREGGISLNPLSFIAQAISSAQVLTEAVRQTLVDKLARIFAGEIPFPIGERRKIKPVKIDLAISNVAEGPFRAGEEVTVFMRAEPGLAATFDIGSKFVGLPLSEQGEGEYIGRYVVSDNDNAEDMIVRINATRVKDKANIQWRVPGRIGIDTIVPETISNIESSPVKDGIRLSWPTATSSHETLTYHIERADPQSGIYEEIAAINIQEYIDQDIVEGTNYHYRIYATDEAENSSPYTNLQVAAVGAGPTEVDEDMLADTTWYPVASPYIISRPVRILRGAVLTISPGTIVRFEGNGKLQVLGQIEAIANNKSPIVFEGQDWQMTFANTGENKSGFKHTKFNGGNINVEQSSVAFDEVEFRTMNHAVKLSNNGKVAINYSEFAQNQVGILVEDGNLSMDQVRFVGNQTAWQARGRMDFLATNLRFIDNDVHVASDKPMTLKNAIFDDADYQTLQQKLEGQVKIDFTNLADEHNLLAAWLKERWMVVLESAKQGLWQEAHDALQSLRSHAPDDKRMNGFYQTLRMLNGKPIERSDEFIFNVQRFDKRGGNGELWIHEVKLPYSKNIVNADGYIKKQAAKKFSGDYLKYSYPELKALALRKYKRKVKIAEHIVDSQVIYATKKGLFLQVWLANYLDMDKIERSLTTAGLIKKANSALVVGLLSQEDVFELEELIVAELKKQGIKFRSLGTGTYGNPLQKKAAKNGVNVVLEAAVKTEENASSLSKSLKRANVNLILSLYDVKTNDNLDRLSGSANKAGFNQREIIKKAVVEAYGTLDSKLVSALWAADDVVTEHKKVEEKARAERERKARIAREKAERERKAKLKAEKARIAREKAAKEKAAKEKAAREAAAKKKAEEERIAREKAVQEKAAQEEAKKAEAVQSEQQQTSDKTEVALASKAQAAELNKQDEQVTEKDSSDKNSSEKDQEEKESPPQNR